MQPPIAGSTTLNVKMPLLLEASPPKAVNTLACVDADDARNASNLSGTLSAAQLGSPKTPIGCESHVVPSVGGAPD
eukprot:442811-Pyramimonas_sp.AAC.1